MSLTVDIKKHYPNFTLDMEFELTGRRIGILGASGCGKSMTLRSIAGIHTPDEGRIVLGDRVLFDSGKHINLKPQVRNVGYLFQNYALFPNMTVRENIMAGLGGGTTSGKKGSDPGGFGVRPRGIWGTTSDDLGYDLGQKGVRPRGIWGATPGKKGSDPERRGLLARFRRRDEEKERRADEMIAKFKLAGLEDRLPSQLSGGQQQRVALARIMAYSPEVILLDEPFSALDWFLKDRMQMEMLEMLRDYEGMVIMVSHDRDEIYRFSEELLIVDDGRVVRSGETRGVFANPGTRAAAALTGCKNFSRAERLDDHHVKAADWGITLETEQVLPEEFRYLGFRAHQFEPVYVEKGRDFRQEGGEAEAGGSLRKEGGTAEACGSLRKEDGVAEVGGALRNVIPCRVASEAQLQFERNFYIRTGAEDADGGYITWLVQRERWAELDERGLPDYLRMNERDLMYLQ